MAARDSTAEAEPRRSVAWRALGWFWAVVLVGTAGGAGVLQYLGPLPSPPPAPASASPAAPPAAAPAASQAMPLPDALPPNAPGTRIAAPDPALLEPAPGAPNARLPRIGADGRLPMRAYAAGYDPADPRPRVAVLLANVAMGEQDSEEAINTLPSAVSLAISPYAQHPGRLLELARATGHEMLVGIPMEPQGYPINDPGPQALMTGLSPAENAARLDRVLSLFAGYVGATGAMGNGLRGERYAASEQITPMLDTLARRGLLYVDPRPGGTLPPQAGAHTVSRAVDVVLDEPPLRVEIEAKLAQLEKLAQDHGSALALAGAPSPVTTARLAAWAAGLAQRGLVLVPVSALVAPQPPTPTAAAPTGKDPTGKDPTGKDPTAAAPPAKDPPR
ncbi:MAG: divergent polysaccharide deacetylase family protein [Rhodospirillales bacterium]|nr:divergent polysaccharide deacetylase family protein [Rhodospirillales bacterium]